MKTFLRKLAALLCCIMPLAAVSCTEETDGQDSKQYLTRINNKVDEVQALLDNSEYGDAAGQYPETSKAILEKVISEMEAMVSAINDGKSVSEDEINALLSSADAAMQEFRDTVNLTDPVDQTQLNVLKNKLSELETLLSEATFGTEPGQYPETSRSILTEAIAALETLISKAESGETTLTEESVETAVAEANAAADEFSATKVPEIVNSTYELVVNGNDGGYIDFGYSEDYVNFGENQNAAFTVEMWVRIDEYCTDPNEDNSTYIACIPMDNFAPQGGWRFYSRYHNGDENDMVRATIAYDDNGNKNCWEPSYYGARLGFGDWMHIAFVYREDGVPGEEQDERFRMFYNGEQARAEGPNGNTSIRLGQDVRHWAYNWDVAASRQTHMTAFGRMDGETMKEYFDGSIKYLRIWKKGFNADEMRAHYQNPAVDATDPDLVCAWDFVLESSETPEITEITDLTGRHTATIKGSHTWTKTE